MEDSERYISATRFIAAPPETLFEFIADPAVQPKWDGNNNLSSAAPGQRVHEVGDVFVMTNVGDRVRENHVVEFEEGRRIAWRPSPVGENPPGHLWRWELEPTTGGSLVRHSYDWTALTDPARFDRARANTPETLRSSLDRLAAFAEAATTEQ